VLTYASRVQEVAAEAPAYDKNINVYRDDTIVATDPNPILANVPKREENYVVVPVVLE
jgi:Asp-tRNA(Asn)/Glu-tRNA(Gln) amidotransferase C subunit